MKKIIENERSAMARHDSLMYVPVYTMSGREGCFTTALNVFSFIVQLTQTLSLWIFKTKDSNLKPEGASKTKIPNGPFTSTVIGGVRPGALLTNARNAV